MTKLVVSFRNFSNAGRKRVWATPPNAQGMEFEATEDTKLQLTGVGRSNGITLNREMF